MRSLLFSLAPLRQRRFFFFFFFSDDDDDDDAAAASHADSGFDSTPGVNAASCRGSSRNALFVDDDSLPTRPSGCFAASQKNVRQPRGRAA